LLKSRLSADRLVDDIRARDVVQRSNGAAGHKRNVIKSII